MARENQVSIKVLLDSDEAKKRLHELQERIDAIVGQSSKLSSPKGFGSSIGDSSGANNGLTSIRQRRSNTTNPSNGLTSIHQRRSNITNQANGVVPRSGNGVGLSAIPNSLQDIANLLGGGNASAGGRGRNKTENVSALGSLLGEGFTKTLMKAGIGAFFAKQFVDFMDLYMLKDTHAGESTYNKTIGKAQVNGAVSGGLSGVMGGAALGTFLGGPIGTIVGGIIGGVGGAFLNGWKKTQHAIEQQRLFHENSDLSVRMANSNSGRGFESNVGSMAFNYGVEMGPTFSGKMALIKSRMKWTFDKLEEYSKELSEWTDPKKGIVRETKVEAYKYVPSMDGMERIRDPKNDKVVKQREVLDANSKEFKAQQEKINIARSELIETAMTGFKERLLKNRITPYDESEFASDSYAKRGITIGSVGFDIQKANDPIINHLKLIVDRLTEISTGKTTAKYADMSNEQLNFVLRQITGIFN